MLGTRCPACGAPTPIALADDATRCVHCGVTAPLEGSVRAHVDAARELLRGLDVRHRQLSATERSALVWDRGLRTVFKVVFAVLGVAVAALIGLFALGVAFEEGSASPLLVLWIVVPAFVAFGAFVFAGRRTLGRLERAREALESTCAAIPPERPGDPMSCHVCGGTLQEQGTASVVRCGYCHADNLVSTGTLARATRAEAIVLDGYEASVRAQAQVNLRSATKGIFLLPAFLVASTIGSCCVWTIAFVSAVSIEGPVESPQEYAWVRSEGRGLCIMRVDRDERGPPIARWGYGDRAHIPLAGPIDRVDLATLAGGTVVHFRRSPPSSESLVIERVYQSPLLPEAAYLRVRDPQGNVSRLEILAGICRPE